MRATVVFVSDLPQFAGEFVFKANATIVATLEAQGCLLAHEDISHSYPHCWRHKSPLIFRATPQWFVSMEQNNLREQVLNAIPTVHYVPDWGAVRMTKMIQSHPGWCISRQRAWGTPMCLFVHKETGELHPDTQTLIEKMAQLVEKDGIDAYFDLSATDILGDEAEDYDKLNDTLDVWFDAGTSHVGVIEQRDALQYPADVYLEGSDQYRGWFQTSLLTAIAMGKHAPFRTVITHGYTVDPQGRKMSKSLGNVVAPDKVVKSLGR